MKEAMKGMGRRAYMAKETDSEVSGFHNATLRLDPVCAQATSSLVTANTRPVCFPIIFKCNLSFNLRFWKATLDCVGLLARRACIPEPGDIKTG